MTYVSAAVCYPLPAGCLEKIRESRAVLAAFLLLLLLLGSPGAAVRSSDSTSFSAAAVRKVDSDWPTATANVREVASGWLHCSFGGGTSVGGRWVSRPRGGAGKRRGDRISD